MKRKPSSSSKQSAHLALLLILLAPATIHSLPHPAIENARSYPMQEFRMTPEDLKVFEGHYQFENNAGAYLQFTAKDKGLVAKQLWDGKEFFIVPKSSIEFYSQGEEFSTKFSKDAQGKVTQVLVFGRDTWKKVVNYTPPKFISLSAEQLKRYEGKFKFQFQPGTDSFIQITAMPDHLVLTEQWSGNKIKFRPQSDLDFYSQERAFPLKFSKDGTGAVTKVLAFNRDLWTKVSQ